MKRRTLLTGMTALFAVLLMAGPVLAALTSVSGGAFGEKVNVTTAGPLPVVVTSGPTPSVTLATDGSNSPQDASVASACVGAGCSILSTGVLTVHTEGTTGPHGSVRSTASVATVNALAGLVTATAVASECTVDSAGTTSGSTTLADLHINNIGVVSNPGPNTEVV
ncbi:MAG: hypothetical protein H0V49_09790, partial [Nocardioidaceae bacterium]|nr:hypothetical protein [Nocardioidaceae bacterium]